MPDHLMYMSFLQPSMTFDDFYFSMNLNKLDSFRNWTGFDSKRYIHKFVYNFTATRIGDLRQPRINSRIKNVEFKKKVLEQ